MNGAEGLPQFNVNWPGMPEEVAHSLAAFWCSAELVNGFAGGPYAPEGYLETYFYNWLLDNGIDDTGGSFAVFIEVTQRMTEIVMQNPTALDCCKDEGEPRRVLGIFDPNLDRPHCFDPRVYEQLKFQYLQRRIDRLADPER